MSCQQVLHQRRWRRIYIISTGLRHNWNDHRANQLSRINLQPLSFTIIRTVSFCFPGNTNSWQSTLRHTSHRAAGYRKESLINLRGKHLCDIIQQLHDSHMTVTLLAAPHAYQSLCAWSAIMLRSLKTWISVMTLLSVWMRWGACVHVCWCVLGWGGEEGKEMNKHKLIQCTAVLVI